MKYSDIALQVLAAKECGIVKSNSQFWKTFPDRDSFEKACVGRDTVMERLYSQLYSAGPEEGFICAYDENFPVINQNVKESDKPFLLFYKGDISLLNNLNKNVAVIGLINPTSAIEKREKIIVKQLVNAGMHIVSGLAKGCDTIAHRVCVDNGGKTIAILPSPINKIAPAENKDLSEDIVLNGGLLLSEYYNEHTGRYEAINRYVERDRLQAMFAKAIVLIASYRKGEGDSGSRHAMAAAGKYGVARFAMFNSLTDSGDICFGLNADLLQEADINALSSSSIQDIIDLASPTLAKDSHEQLSFFNRS